ncbi:2-amino-4-hydroxy-6-hydroxymethyldihydropteridine diphosphokinase [uncultured Bacteroides sp.]|uniref:2-amino-4-hydroxy-6- hydroxymethyldihydropteridine diphosphokinase n=1 Tax=uncultured Bacteroides sp. TaxID=162156 RepID=UPI002AAB2924|nr:2-amino-4-hydroxy-6-hydroxymethyldihydropteridine diphosphokinase [uncultured Bacteroides sp.]
MEQHICIISIGSNANRNNNIKLAQKQLSLYFPDIRFGTEQDTLPVGMCNPAHFTNQLAKASTSLTIEEVKNIFKRIESQAGRLSEDKKNEIVKLDIDLLMYDSFVLKESDMKRDFIITELKELGL